MAHPTPWMFVDHIVARFEEVYDSFHVSIKVQRGCIVSGQIIATSHDLTPDGAIVRDIPLFQGNLGW